MRAREDETGFVALLGALIEAMTSPVSCWHRWAGLPPCGWVCDGTCRQETP